MKRFFLALLFLPLALQIYSQNQAYNTNYAEYTLSNGLSLYVMEDFSKAQISIEISVKAGLSSQEKENNGFFELYSRLINYDENSREIIRNLKAECNSDSSRYRTQVSPLLFEESIEKIKRISFNPYFSDEAIKKEYSKLEKEVSEYAKTPASFINTAIDSRVFSREPWKNASSINPEYFSGKKIEEVRKILTNIQENWYSCQNSSIFISGSIKKEECLEICKKTFSDLRASPVSLNLTASQPFNENKKFILVSDDFSTDLTQIAVQYTSLSLTQADLASCIFNNPLSESKRLLLKQRNLAIRDESYINYEGAHKNGSSRLIIQSLLEKPVNPKVNICEQAELFTSKLAEGIANTDQREAEIGKNSLIKDFSRITANSEIFMDYLSQFKSIEDFSSESAKEKSLKERLLSRPKLIEEVNFSEIKEKLAEESPFVFLFLNTKIYRANEKFFKEKGYITITQKNALWYSTEEAEKENEESEEYIPTDFESEIKSNFIEESRSSIKRIYLQNGIPLTVKTSQATENILIMISLELGKFSFDDDPGFEEIITRAFANNIQKEVYKYEREQYFSRSPEILSETFYSWSAVTIECAKEDAGLCLQCISDAIIYGEILPSEADSYFFSVQTQKRLYNANPVNQLTYRGIRWLYDQKIIRSVFSTDADVLTNTSYQQILNAYPSLLNSKLYNIVIVGNIDYDYILEPLKKTFGLLAEQKSEVKKLELQEIEFPSEKAVSVNLRHLFYTDIKAEEAGPMPAILIPTTNFSDPVQFWLPAPVISYLKDENSLDEIVYDALILRFKERLEEEEKDRQSLGEEEIFTGIKHFERKREIPASAFSFMAVSHTQKLEQAFSQAQKDFLALLSEENPERDEEIKMIKNSWILNYLKGTGSNRGSAILIREGGSNPRSYLDKYEILMNAEAEDFLKCAEKYIVSKPPLRLYSSESKR